MMTFVTHRITTGTADTSSRRIKLHTTARGAESQTMRNTGGMFCRASTRSRHLGLGDSPGFVGLVGFRVCPALREKFAWSNQAQVRGDNPTRRRHVHANYQ